MCEDCSYNCEVCGLKIDDLAIMTTNEAYHADCFCCRVCKRKIEDLVFAKTSQGIYCMDCHNDRISRSRSRRKEQQYHHQHRGAIDHHDSPSLSKTSSINLDLDKGLPSIPRAVAISARQQRADHRVGPSAAVESERAVHEPEGTRSERQNNEQNRAWRLDIPPPQSQNVIGKNDADNANSHQRDISVHSTPSTISLSEFQALYDKDALAETYSSAPAKFLSQGFSPVLDSSTNRVRSTSSHSRQTTSRSGSMPSSSRRKNGQSHHHLRTPSEDAPVRHKITDTAPYSTPRSEGYSIPEGVIIYDDTPHWTELASSEPGFAHGNKVDEIPPVPTLPTMHPKRHSETANGNNTPTLTTNSPNIQQEHKAQLPSPSLSLPPKSNRRPVPRSIQDSSNLLQGQLLSPDPSKSPLSPTTNLQTSPQISLPPNKNSATFQVIKYPKTIRLTNNRLLAQILKMLMLPTQLKLSPDYILNGLLHWQN